MSGACTQLYAHVRPTMPCCAPRRTTAPCTERCTTDWRPMSTGSGTTNNSSRQWLSPQSCSRFSARPLAVRPLVTFPPIHKPLNCHRDIKQALATPQRGSTSSKPKPLSPRETELEHTLEQVCSCLEATAPDLGHVQDLRALIQRAHEALLDAAARERSPRPTSARRRPSTKSGQQADDEFDHELKTNSETKLLLRAALREEAEMTPRTRASRCGSTMRQLSTSGSVLHTEGFGEDEDEGFGFSEDAQRSTNDSDDADAQEDESSAVVLQKKLVASQESFQQLRELLKARCADFLNPFRIFQWWIASTHRWHLIVF